MSRTNIRWQLLSSCVAFDISPYMQCLVYSQHVMRHKVEKCYLNKRMPPDNQSNTSYHCDIQFIHTVMSYDGQLWLTAIWPTTVADEHALVIIENKMLNADSQQKTSVVTKIPL